MCRTKSSLILSTILASATFAGPAAAQEVEDEIVIEGKYLYSDQVNALKTPVPIIDVPQSLSIVTDLEIKQRGYTEIGDIIRYTPGVNTSQGEGHRDSIVFRGNRSTADFYIDGVRDDVQYYRPLYNLEQVEILRGPNALLFGRGGTGGIVNRVTKKGVIGEQFTALDFGIDTFGGYDVTVDSNVATSENSAFRINAYYAGLENHRDFYDGERFGLNPTFNIELSPQTTLSLSYEYADHERFIDRGIPTLNGGPVEAFEDITFGDPDINITTLEAHILRGTLSHDFSESLKGNVTVHYGEYEKVYQNLYASGYDGSDADNDGNTEVTLDGYLDPTERTNFVISGNLVSEFETGSIGHTLLFGAEHIDTQSDNLRYNTFWSTTSDDNEVFNITRPLDLTVNASGVATSVDFTTDLNNQTSTDIIVTSLFIQDQIDLTDQFKLLLGGRFDSFDITVDDIDDATSESRKDEEFSPRFGLVYKPRQNISLYGSYSETFLPRSGEQFKTLSADSARLDPDVFENAEIGLKWDFVPALSFTAAYFQSEQTRAERDNTTGETSEVRGLEVNGFELQLEGQITDKFYITGGYSYLDGETSSGVEPRELPENMASLWGAYDVTENFGFGLGFTYQDESLISDGSTQKLPSYTRVDAAAYYTVSEDLAIRLNVENLTDELYFPHSHSTHQVTVGEPLNARLSVSSKF